MSPYSLSFDARRGVGCWLSLLALIGLRMCAISIAAEPSGDALHSCGPAALRGLRLVEQAAARYPDHRKCFSCHHQTLPLLAMTAARQRGIEIDAGLLKSQADFTHASFAGRLDSLKAGTGIGGRAMTVGYGLWTFKLIERPGDEVTSAMVGYLLKNQNEDGHWGPPSNRPPLEESKVMCTVLAMYGMQEYADEPQRGEVDAAISKGRLWLDAAAIESQEDRVARLWGLHLFDGSAESRRAAQQAILDEQHDDGSWSQLDDMSGDAYATGLTLSILHETGFDPQQPAYIKGCGFLLRNQLPDGSWLVETRSKPVQVYFDNGDPHGKHQFISTAASSWAVAALAAAGETAAGQKQAKQKQAEATSCPD